MFLQAFSWLAFLEAVVLQSLAMHGPWWRTRGALTLGIPTIQRTVGFYTMEILICPNFLHLLWSFQFLGDTHLHATVQVISCFTGCILKFFSDGSPSDILWQLSSKVGHEFKKYVIWTPLTINCLHAFCLFGFFALKKLFPFNVNTEGWEKVCKLATLQSKMQ